MQQQTLRELLATFPDPPKTSLTSTGPSPSPPPPGSSGPVGGLGGAPIGFSGPRSFQEEEQKLLARACQAELDPDSQGKVFQMLLTHQMLPVEQALDAAYITAQQNMMQQIATQKKKKIEKIEKDVPCSPCISLREHFADFGGDKFPVGQFREAKLVLRNDSTNKIKFRVFCPPGMSLSTPIYDLSIGSTGESIIKKKETATIALCLHAKSPGPFGVVLIVAVEDGLRFHVVCKGTIVPS